MENCGRFVFYNNIYFFFKKNEKQNNRHCVTCCVISMAYTLIDHCSRPISARGFAQLLLNTFLNPKILGFRFFFTKNSLPWGVKCETQIKLRKIVGNLLDELRKLYMNRTVIEKFLAAVE